MRKYGISNWIFTACVACIIQFWNWFLQAKNPVCWNWFLQLNFTEIKHKSTGGEGLWWYQPKWKLPKWKFSTFYMKHTNALSIFTWFLKSLVHKLNFQLDFLSISNLIFPACVAFKNPVRNRQKIKFKNLVQKSSSKLDISKIKYISGTLHKS